METAPATAPTIMRRRPEDDTDERGAGVADDGGLHRRRSRDRSGRFRRRGAPGRSAASRSRAPRRAPDDRRGARPRRRHDAEGLRARSRADRLSAPPDREQRVHRDPAPAGLRLHDDLLDPGSDGSRHARPLGRGARRWIRQPGRGDRSLGLVPASCLRRVGRARGVPAHLEGCVGCTGRSGLRRRRGRRDRGAVRADIRRVPARRRGGSRGRLARR